MIHHGFGRFVRFCNLHLVTKSIQHASFTCLSNCHSCHCHLLFVSALSTHELIKSIACHSVRVSLINLNRKLRISDGNKLSDLTYNFLREFHKCTRPHPAFTHFMLTCFPKSKKVPKKHRIDKINQEHSHSVVKKEDVIAAIISIILINQVVTICVTSS